jgi:hypothetical protein
MCMGSINIKKIFGNVAKNKETSFFDLVPALPQKNKKNDTIQAGFSVRSSQDSKKITLLIKDCQGSSDTYWEDLNLSEKRESERDNWGPKDRRVRATLEVSKTDDGNISVKASHYNIYDDVLEGPRVGCAFLEREEKYFMWQEQHSVINISDDVRGEDHAGLILLSDLLVRYASDHPTIKDYIQADEADIRCIEICRLRQLIQLDKKYFFNPT